MIRFFPDYPQDIFTLVLYYNFSRWKYRSINSSTGFYVQISTIIYVCYHETYNIMMGNKHYFFAFASPMCNYIAKGIAINLVYKWFNGIFKINE